MLHGVKLDLLTSWMQQPGIEMVMTASVRGSIQLGIFFFLLVSSISSWEYLKVKTLIRTDYFGHEFIFIAIKFSAYSIVQIFM